MRLADLPDVRPEDPRGLKVVFDDETPPEVLDGIREAIRQMRHVVSVELAVPDIETELALARQRLQLYNQMREIFVPDAAKLPRARGR